MAVTGVIKVMKWILVAINIPLLCAGAIAIGLGAWALASEFGAEKLKDLTGSELYRGAAIAIIVGGSVLALISLIGILGAVLENRVLLGIYFVIVLLLLILFVTSAAVGFAYRDKLKDELSRQMETTLLNQYMVNIDKSDDNNDVTGVWDDLQKKLDCCGVIGERTSEKSWFIWQKSTWYLQQTDANKDLVPSSCCVSQKVNENCQKAKNGTSSMPPKTYSNSSITTANPDLNDKGCITKLEDYIFDRAIAIGGIAIAILILMFLCLLLSVCVCTHIKKTKGDAM